MGELGVTWANLLIQLIAFVLFVVIFWKLALGPITRMIDQRQERIREGIEAAERMKRELAATQARNEEIIAEARREAQRILASARESADQVLLRAREQAQTEAEQIVAQAREAIETERQRAWDELRRDVADLAITAATKIIRQELDRTRHLALIEETLAEVGNGRLRAAQ
jgi:F-type H+-transporting ATPase subunit b